MTPSARRRGGEVSSPRFSGGAVVQNPYLIGSSVYLRPLEVSDAATLQAWFNDPDVRRTLLRYKPMTLTAEEEFLRSSQNSDTNLILGVATRSENHLVGCTGLHQIDVRNRHATFGIAIGDKNMWGRGYGTEVTRFIVEHAFRTLNLNRVWLHVLEFNERGIRAYKKVGFREEGRLRQHQFVDGRYWDIITMAVLREEFNA
jgi:RimJ/RimL family protein N-acetyltransferase